LDRNLERNHDKETSSTSEALRLHCCSDLGSGRDNLLRPSAGAARKTKSSAASETESGSASYTKSSPAGASESPTANSIKPGASHHSQSSSFNHSKSGASYCS
jgi:hypothetical protein